jgi:hypothetical protein
MMTQILAGIVVNYVVKPQHMRGTNDDMEFRKAYVETKLLRAGSWKLHRGEICKLPHCGTFIP